MKFKPIKLEHWSFELSSEHGDDDPPTLLPFPAGVDRITLPPVNGRYTLTVRYDGEAVFRMRTHPLAHEAAIEMAIAAEGLDDFPLRALIDDANRRRLDAGEQDHRDRVDQIVEGY